MKRTCHCSKRARGAAVVVTAICLLMMLSFAVLAIDVGHIYAARAELQNAADAAALAGAACLGESGGDGPESAALGAATAYARRNKVFRQGPELEPQDVVFGNGVLEGDRYRFVPGGVSPDAVRVTVRRMRNSRNGPLPLYLAPLFGKPVTDVAASAAAMIIPRDIAVVADLSTSHTDDSELRHYRQTDINIWEVWASLSAAGAVSDPQDPQTAGPFWGNLSYLGWGTLEIDDGYDPSSDAGLAYLPNRSDWNDAALRSVLSANGYSASEVSAITSGTYDSYSGVWRNRVGVALGLARWNSGKNGPGGNGDDRISDSEVTWDPYPYGNSSWGGWIDYVASRSTAMCDANSGFQYRFGAKTFVNYLLERRTAHGQEPYLAASPVQPMQAVKDAVVRLAEMVEGLDTDDQLSLEVYSTDGHHEVDLTRNYYEVPQRLNAIDAGYYGDYTNMGAGIAQAIEELTGPRARASAKKVMFLLTDGLANVNASGRIGDEQGGREYALAMAQAAAREGIRIFTITVGSAADRELMAEIAGLGGGETFHAEGSIEQYSAQLEAIFSRLALTRPVVLIE